MPTQGGKEFGVCSTSDLKTYPRYTDGAGVGVDSLVVPAVLVFVPTPYVRKDTNTYSRVYSEGVPGQLRVNFESQESLRFL